MAMLRYYEYFKKYVVCSYPLIASELANTIIPLADNLMVGQIGFTSLAAASLANHIFTACLIIPKGISYGLTPLIVAAQAKQQYSKIRYLFTNVLCMNTLVGVLLIGIILGVAWLLPVLKQDPQVSALAQPYLQIIALSIIPMMLFITFARFLEALGYTNQLMRITLISTVVNILFNYMLIYGAWGMPKLGLNGAGCATLLSRTVMMVLAGAYVLFSSELEAYQIDIKRKYLNTTYFLKLARLGIPVGLQLGGEMMAFACMAIMAGCLGASAQAAHAIVSNVLDIALGITWAIGTTSILVSRPFSIRNTQALKEISIIGFLIVIFVYIMLTLRLLYSYRYIFVGYNTNQEVLGIAASLVVISAVFNLADSIYTIAIGILRGMQETFQPMVIAYLSNWLIGLPISYILAFKLTKGITGIWIGKTVAFALAALIFLLRFYQKMHQLSKHK